MMKPVFLIGYMGCGKTTLGEALARQMGLRFIDLDEWIETRQGMTIVKIFDEQGEGPFRKLEEDALREVASMTDVIVSCGGRRGLLLPDLDGVDTVEEQIDIARQKGGIGKREPYTLQRFEVVRHY